MSADTPYLMMKNDRTVLWRMCAIQFLHKLLISSSNEVFYGIHNANFHKTTELITVKPWTPRPSFVSFFFSSHFLPPASLLKLGHQNTSRWKLKMERKPTTTSGAKENSWMWATFLSNMWTGQTKSLFLPISLMHNKRNLSMSQN